MFFNSIKEINRLRKEINKFYYYLDFLSRTLTIHRTAGEVGGYLFNSSLPFPPASPTLRR